MKRLIILVVLATALSAPLAAQQFISYDRNVRLYMSQGLAYNFNVSARMFGRSDLAFLETPFRLAVDTRVVKWLSIYAGLDFVYSYHLYTYRGYEINKHNLFIRLPLHVRFYPMSLRDERYKNFYLSLGLFAHFWPVNGYVINAGGGKVFQGTAYSTEDNMLFPPAVYTKANVGFTISLGNSFVVRENVLFGLELFSNYLFIPFLNGYAIEPNFKIEDDIMLNFMVNVGIAFSFGFELASF